MQMQASTRMQLAAHTSNLVSKAAQGTERHSSNHNRCQCQPFKVRRGFKAEAALISEAASGFNPCTTCILPGQSVHCTSLVNPSKPLGWGSPGLTPGYTLAVALTTGRCRSLPAAQGTWCSWGSWPWARLV
jgi:hypothetical protein